MTQVFISYSRKDLAFVECLVKDLKTAGLEVWYDLSGLEIGMHWSKEIEAAICESQYILFILSPNSVESEWVEREFIYASNHNLKIIPVIYEPSELPLWSVNLHYISMHGKDYASNLNELLKAMGIEPRLASVLASHRSPASNRNPSVRQWLLWGLAGLVLLGIVLGLFIFRKNIPTLFLSSTPDLAMTPSFTYVPSPTSPPAFTDTILNTSTQYPTNTPIPALLQLTNSEGKNFEPSFSPDGRKIVFISTRDGNDEIYLMELDGSEQVRLTNTPDTVEEMPSFSPDGSMILFSSNNGHNDDLYLVNIDGTQVRNITDTPFSNEGRPKFIFGDTASLKVIFDSDRSGNWDIYMATLGVYKLENIAQITNRMGYYNRLPSYLPATQQILFRSARGASVLFLIDMDGNNLTQFSHPPYGKNDYFPSASIDGKWILFSSDRDGNREIYVAKPDGTYLKNISNNPAQEDTCAMSPNDYWIVFSSDQSGSYQLYRVPFTP
jgi:TolB protein